MLLDAALYRHLFLDPPQFRHFLHPCRTQIYIYIYIYHKKNKETKQPCNKAYSGYERATRGKQGVILRRCACPCNIAGKGWIMFIMFSGFNYIYKQFPLKRKQILRFFLRNESPSCRPLRQMTADPDPPERERRKGLSLGYRFPSKIECAF